MCKAQETGGVLTYSFELGYSTFDMSDLKKLNELTVKVLPFDTKRVNNFDPHLNFNGTLNINISGSIKMGLIFNYLTTGSRLGQKDYSGYYVLDQILNGYMIGAGPEIILGGIKKSEVSLSLFPAVLYTNARISENILVGSYNNKDSYSLSSSSFVIYPCLKFLFPLKEYLAVHFAAGALFDTGGKFHLKDDRKALININNNPARTGWSGLRVGVGIDISLYDLIKKVKSAKMEPIAF